MNFTFKIKRVTALVLIAVLCLAMMPVMSFAQEEITICSYCGEILSGSYNCFSVQDGYYSDVLDCDEHFPQSECDVCAEYMVQKGMLCDVKYDIIEIEVDGDDGVEYEMAETAHEHTANCYVECAGNCGSEHICVAPCPLEHEDHSVECYVWVDTVCQHNKIIYKTQEENDPDGNPNDGLDIAEDAQLGKTRSSLMITGQPIIDSIYTVTFESLDGTEITTVNVGAGSVIPDEDVPSLDPSPVHWYLGGAADPSTEAFNFLTEVTGNITLRPYYEDIEPITYTVSVTYIAEGVESKVDILSVGELAIEPIPPAIPSDYLSFLGWYIEDTDELFDFSEPVAKSVILVARFSDQYLIKFKNNAGVVVHTMLASPNAQVIYPADLSVIGIDYQISNGTFKYWYDEESSAPSDGIFVSGTVATKNLTLMPYYNNEYLLIFISEGTQVEAQAVSVGAATKAPQNPTRAGYTFDKWVYYDTGDEFVFGNTVSEDTMLRATWTPVLTKYTIVYWCEKPNIEGDPGIETANYGFYSSVAKQASSGTAISDLNISGTLASINAFSFRHQTCTTDTVLGNGLTVVNVYFKRNEYTFTFNLNPATGYYATMTLNGATYTQGKTGTTDTQYSFTAKLDQNIDELWPSSANAEIKRFSRNTGAVTSFTVWSSTGISDLVTHRWTLTSDLLPSTGSTTRTFTAKWGTTNSRQVNYWFERLLSESEVTDAKQITFNGVSRYYVISSDYSQKVDLSTGSSLSAKTYTGMSCVGEANTSASGTVSIYNFYYTRNRYVLNFDTRGGNPVTLNSAYNYNSVMYGEALSLYKPADPIKTGENGTEYRFLGWYYDTEYKLPVDFYKDTMPNYSLQLFAKWESTELTVNYYDGIGGQLLYSQGRAFGEYANTDGIHELQNYNIGSSVDGKGVFNGWLWKVSSIYTTFSFDMPISRNIDLYAAWLVDGFIITYDANGGTGSVPVDSDKYKFGVSTMVLNSSSLVKGSQVFVGWQVEGSGRVYYPGNMIKITGNMKLKAVYASASEFITIVYHSNNDYNDTYRVKILLADTEYETAGALFSETGCTLRGWNTVADGSGTEYELSKAYSIADIKTNTVGSTLDLYAQWSKVQRYSVTYTQSFSGEEPDDTAPFAEFASENNSSYQKDDATVPFSNALSYADVIGSSGGVPGVFEFIGWTSRPDGVQINESNNTLTMPDSDVEFTANWTFSPTYAVTYQWASAYADIVKESYVLNQDSTRYTADADAPFLGSESYSDINSVISIGRIGKLVFTGWTDSVTGSDIDIAFTDASGLFKMPAEDVVFTGNWEFVPDVVTLAVTKRFDGITDTSLISSRFKIEISYRDANNKAANYWLSIIDDGITVYEGEDYVEYRWTIENFPANTAFKIAETGEAIEGYVNSASASLSGAALNGSNGWQVSEFAASEQGSTPAIAITNNYDKYTVNYKWAEGTILPTGSEDLPESGKYTGGTTNIPVADGYADIEVKSANNNVLAIWTFNGWVPDENSEVTVTDGRFTMPNDDVIFIGSWTLTNVAELSVLGYSGQYNGLGQKVTIDENTLFDGDILYYSLTGTDAWQVEPLSYTDVTRDAGGNLAPIAVFVRAVNVELGTDRIAFAAINISQRSITLSADTESYRYNGSTHEITTYTLSGDGIVDTEILSAYAYGSGKGISESTVSYNVTFNGSITVTKANGASSTGNYNIKTLDGLLTIWDTATTTTTPTPSPSESLSVSEPPVESGTQGESESQPPSEPPSISTPPNHIEETVELPPLERIVRPGTPDVYPEPAREGSTLIEWEELLLIEISDVGIPLGNWAYEAGEEVWIFEPEIPLGYAPVTGDSTNLAQVLFLVLASFFALVCVFVIKIKTGKNIKR